MATSLLLSSLLALAAATSPEWKPTCGATQEQNLLALIQTDVIARHFNSGALNSTLTECSNFHRHICPKQGMSTAASFQGIFNEIVAIERSCSKYDVLTKIENHFAFADQFDHFNYSNKDALSTLLFLMPKSTLLTIYEYTSLHKQAPKMFFSSVWNRRHWTAAIDQAKFPAKYDATTFTDFAKRKAFVEGLAADIKTITETSGGFKKMKEEYLPFLTDVTNFNHILNVMFRNGIETGPVRDRHHATIYETAEEYGRQLENAAWSSLAAGYGKTRYDVFYDFLMDCYDNTLHSNLNNLGVQNASLTFSKDFYTAYLEERTQLSSLVILPFLRNFIAINRAHERMIATIDLDMTNRWYITSSKANPTVLSGFFVQVCVRNAAIFDLVGNNSPDGAVHGVMTYLYGHEMYHGVERELYPVVMPDSPVTAISHSCVDTYYNNFVLRFPGDDRFMHWPMEEEADFYGTQIAYGAFKNAMGSRIDDIAYPSLNITHRQLFFYANSIFGCNVHDDKYINGERVLVSPHYEVNGRLAQLSDFAPTFQCSASDNMVVPESEYCPIFFPSYTA